MAAAEIRHQDPAGHFGRAAYRLERNWDASRLLVYPSVIDGRALRAAPVQVLEKPELVLLGSSRVMPVGAGMFRPGLRVFNAGMAGAVVQDYAAVWQVLAEAGKTPPRLLIYADPWIFNKNAGQFRWRALGGLYERFRLRTGGGQGLLLARAGLLWERLRRWNTAFNESLNGPVLVAALRGARPDGRGCRTAAGPGGRGSGPGALGWRADGSVHFIRTARSSAELREAALRFAGETEVFSLGRYEPDAGAKELLDALAADAAPAGTEVRFIVLPYHQAARSRIEERPQYRGLIDGFAAELRGRGFSLCEAQDPAASGCAPEEFEDAMHPLESCHEKILRRCLSGGPWKDLLPASAPALAAVAPPAPRPSPRTAAPAPPAAVLPPPAPPAQIEWILIPGGSYMMGAPDLGAEPVHRVVVPTFEMAKAPVTVDQYRACVRAGRCFERAGARTATGSAPAGKTIRSTAWTGGRPGRFRSGRGGACPASRSGNTRPAAAAGTGCIPGATRRRPASGPG